jgi:hypothetical protein
VCCMNTPFSFSLSLSWCMCVCVCVCVCGSYYLWLHHTWDRFTRLVIVVLLCTFLWTSPKLLGFASFLSLGTIE